MMDKNALRIVDPSQVGSRIERQRKKVLAERDKFYNLARPKVQKELKYGGGKFENRFYLEGERISPRLYYDIKSGGDNVMATMLRDKDIESLNKRIKKNKTMHKSAGTVATPGRAQLIEQVRQTAFENELEKMAGEYRSAVGRYAKMTPAQQDSAMTAARSRVSAPKESLRSFMTRSGYAKFPTKSKAATTRSRLSKRTQ